MGSAHGGFSLCLEGEMGRYTIINSWAVANDLA